MRFITIPCHENLQPFIRNYWLLDAQCTARGSQRIFSNGAASLHFYLTQPVSLDGSDFVYRTSLNRHDLSCMDVTCQPGIVQIFGVEFVPFCSRLFFKSDDESSHLTPEMLGDEEMISMAQQVHEAADNEERKLVLDEFFCKRIMQIPVNEVNMERMEEVFQDIVPVTDAPSALADYENLSPADLASTACLSQKQFTRVFSEYVGMRPKAYLRLLRFHKALKELQNVGQGQSLTDVAWRCGYYDLPHMNTEFRQLCGFSPSEVVEKGAQLTETFHSGFSDRMKKKVLVENLI